MDELEYDKLNLYIRKVISNVLLCLRIIGTDLHSTHS